VNRLERTTHAARYALELPRFLRSPVTSLEARERISTALARRHHHFLDVLERGVYARPESPYRALLIRARIELGDVAGLVRDTGVEGALERLYDEGVYISLAEFKGRRPILRPGLELPVTAADFDNRLASAHLEKSTGGSRGTARKVTTDLRLIAYEAGHHRLFLDALGLGGRPMAIWAGTASTSARVALRHLKAGETVDRWLVKRPPPTGRQRLTTERLIPYSVAASRLVGPGRLPTPEFVPVAEAASVARWLGSMAAAGRPALLDTTPSCAVRAGRAAAEHGIDITGTWFRLAGEPYTNAKAAIIESVGASAVCHYSMSEIGRVGMACAAPTAVDDVHLLTDKVALLRRPRSMPEASATEVFHITTLLASSPKLMLNVEVDDHGVIETQVCDCPLGELGLVTHLHGIRSHEKLTAEGVSFLGEDLILLVDEVLPARFGGAATDYQLVEEEMDGITRLAIVVAPRTGPVDERAVVEVVVNTLRANPENRGTVDGWRSAGTLRVVRREPYQTSAAKLLPLHFVPRGGSG
jgi:hypothetical protein